MKLTLGFGFLVLTTIVITIVASLGQSGLENEAVYILEGPFYRFARISYIQNELNLIRRNRNRQAAQAGETPVRQEEIDRRIVSSNAAFGRIADHITGYRNSIYADVNLAPDVVANLSRMLGEIESDIASLQQNKRDVVASASAGELTFTLDIIDANDSEIARLDANVSELMNLAANTMDASVGNMNDYASQTTMILWIVVIIGGVIGILVAIITTKSITGPITRLGALVGDVTQGKMNINSDANLPTDEVGTLTRDVYGLVNVVTSMVQDVAELKHQFSVVGDTEYTIDENKYQNSFKELMSNTNNVVGELIQNMLVVLNALNQIINGDFTIKIENMPGKRQLLPDTVHSVTNNLKNVVAEIDAMVNATSINGDLSFRIDANNYKGDWRKITLGLNDVAKAVDAPLTVIEMCLYEMKQGNFDLQKIERIIKDKTGLNPSSESYSGIFRRALSAADSTVEEVASYVADISQSLAKVANGDLRVKITRDYIGDFVVIKESINTISASLSKTMSEINSASEQVLSGAKQISTSATDLANGANQQASSVEELNASVDLINQQTQANAQNANKANELSNTSMANAGEGNDAMQQTLSAMNEIKDSSNNISKIIRTIQDIAFQTNLLALNAAVEAARAGEHGKGFAVVAEEVRSLAARSQEAASETTELISTSINTVESGSEIAGSTAKSLDTIVDNVSNVKNIVSEISTASNEQAEAVSQVVTGLSQISQVVQSNSAVSEETAAASEELSSQAELLKQLVSYFKM